MERFQNGRLMSKSASSGNFASQNRNIFNLALSLTNVDLGVEGRS